MVLFMSDGVTLSVSKRIDSADNKVLDISNPLDPLEVIHSAHPSNHCPAQPAARQPPVRPAHTPVHRGVSLLRLRLGSTAETLPEPRALRMRRAHRICSRATDAAFRRCSAPAPHHRLELHIHKCEVLRK
ncbi:unnamed protein product [Pleuronectes platessa]|uniref:Uncharacterized protein n=1 Tax=Pleuronectes platessa TaxID=8262 RepID=A0A9N7USZ9_PLEPL|nr:unnamed protein product [Pleuronectes platessa]